MFEQHFYIYSFTTKHLYIKKPFNKKTQEFRIWSQKGGGASRPIRNPYFDLVSEDPMLTGSPNEENEQVFRWFRTCFIVENSQIIQQNSWVFLLKGSLTIVFYWVICIQRVAIFATSMAAEIGHLEIKIWPIKWVAPYQFHVQKS